MRRTFIIGVMFQAMFMCIANVAIMPSMYLPSQNVVAEFIEVVDAQGNVLEQNDYYPYGGLFGESASHQSYKYSGKELERMNGLNTYDFHARPYYYPTLQFHSPDILSEKTPWLSPYLYCAGNPIMLIDPTGMEWYSIEEIKQNQETGENYTETVYLYTSLKSQEEMNAAGVKGRFLGEVVIVFNGSMNEKLGEDNTLKGAGAVAAEVTIYGKNGADDIQTYNGLTVSSDPSKYPMIEQGEYLAYHEQMATSVYGKDALTYRISQRNGNLQILPKGGHNKNTGLSYISSVFLHRTNWNGRADKSSKGCLVIDGRSWRSVEKQIEKSKNIYIKLNRK